MEKDAEESSTNISNLENDITRLEDDFSTSRAAEVECNSHHIQQGVFLVIYREYFRVMHSSFFRARNVSEHFTTSVNRNMDSSVVNSAIILNLFCIAALGEHVTESVT